MKQSLNLLPHHIQQQQRIRTVVRRWLAVWAVALLAGLALIATKSHRCQTARRLHLQLQAEYAPMQQARQDARHLRRELEAVRRQVNAAWSLADQHPTLSLLGAVSLAAATTGPRTAVVHLAMQSGADDAPGPEKDSVVTIQGYSRDHIGIAQFMSELARLDMFANVDLDSAGSSPKPRAGAGYQGFTIRCTY